jgi:hypothetical protein
MAFKIKAVTFVFFNITLNFDIFFNFFIFLKKISIIFAFTVMTFNWAGLPFSVTHAPAG